MSTITATPTSTTGPSTPDSTSSSSQAKKYSLVKWLENSQFDAQNEWLGRLTSIQHSNIIDFDADELKPGMEISVFRNGEIWRAQVIIPKTASNTIDLPASTHKVSKIRTKAMGTTLTKLNDSIEMMDTGASSLDENKTFIDLNDICSSSGANPSANDDLSNNTLMILTNAPSTTTSTSNQSNTVTLTNANHSSGVSVVSSTPILNRNKELQFLQTAICEAGISDFYQAYNNSNNNSNNSLNTTPTISSSNGGALSQNDQPQILLKSNNNFLTITSGGMVQQPAQIPAHLVNNVITVSDGNIETILQMQSEYLEHQKELKSIENETMEQLKMLHQNISKLAKKFDSFESIIGNLCTLNQNSVNNSISQAQTNGLSSNIKSAKSTLNKLNNSIQQIRLEELSSAIISPSSSATSSTTTATLAAIPQAINNLQLIINPTTNTATTSQIQTLTPIQLDNITNTNNKTIKQLTESSNFTKTTTILLASPIQLQQIPTATVGTGAQSSTVTATLVPTTLNTLSQATASVLAKESNEIISNSNNNNENNVEMKLVDSKENKNNSSNNNKLQGIQTQMQLNKFLRESVKQILGIEYLMTHAVSDIPLNIMNEIKKEALEKYLPNDRRPIKAWDLALASLRCLKRDLSKSKNKPQTNSQNEMKKKQISTLTNNSLINTITTRQAAISNSNISTITTKKIVTTSKCNYNNDANGNQSRLI